MKAICIDYSNATPNYDEAAPSLSVFATLELFFYFLFIPEIIL
jgi:hypothetical protein